MRYVRVGAVLSVRTLLARRMMQGERRIWCCGVGKQQQAAAAPVVGVVVVEVVIVVEVVKQ